MSFDLKAELAKIGRELDAVQAAMGAGPADLLKQFDFVEACDGLAARLERALREVPPPEPTPPVTEQQIEIEEDQLRDLTWAERNIPFGRRKGPLPDAQNRIPEKVTRHVTVTLPSPQMPGSPEAVFNIEVSAWEAHKVPRPVARPALPKEFDESVEGEESAEDEPIGRRAFDYELRKVMRAEEVHAPAVPPDAPLTKAQQNYVRRLKEIEVEVRDIKTFIADLDRRVSALRSAADALVTASERLERQVGQLPKPRDIVPELDAISDRVKAVRAQLPAVEQDLNTYGPLQALSDSVKAACPEIA